MKWETMTLGELCKKHNGQIQTGPFGSQLHQSDYKEVGTPVVMPKDIINDKISTEGIARISDTDVARLSKHILKKGDIVFPRRGEINKRALITDESEGFICGTGCLKISINSEQVSNMFLNYYLARKESVDWLENNAVGSTMKNLSGQILSNIPIEMPPINTQRRIASILSAYDDLIENNLRRIKLLEEAAQHIYREWFVRMRFPGWEGAKFGEDGVPEGWRKVNLYDFADIQMGFPFNGSLFNDEKIGTPAIRIRDIPSNRTFTYTTEEADEKYFVEQGDILIGMDGFFYTDVWAGQRGYLVQRVCRIRAKDPMLQGYLLEALKTPIKFFEQTISGATVSHLGAKHLKQIEILFPEPSHEAELQIFNNLHNQRIKLHSQNAHLKEARDILLPRLMNQTTEV